MNRYVDSYARYKLEDCAKPLLDSFLAGLHFVIEVCVYICMYVYIYIMYVCVYIYIYI